ncbi:MAG: transposase [Gammaproteobacteria bacterium]
MQRNRLISQARHVVERTFGSQERWFAGKTLRYRGLAKAHAWHLLLAMAYCLKRLPVLCVNA